MRGQCVPCPNSLFISKKHKFMKCSAVKDMNFVLSHSCLVFKDFYGICIYFKMSFQKASLVLCHNVYICIFLYL